MESRLTHTVTNPATGKPIPNPSPAVGLKALDGMRRRRSVIGALDVFHQEMGDVFKLPMPGFNPVMLAGPEASRFVLITARDDLRWRMENEPITILLRHGVLVEDDASHNDIRRTMNPALHRSMLTGHVHAMIRAADRISLAWASAQPYNMLSEMRKIALLTLTDALFGVDFSPEMDRLWRGILRAVAYISPGPWVIWRRLSHMGYDRHIREIDAYLFRIIAERRAHPVSDGHDLLSVLIASGMGDDLIRDQLMTMIIAGHDTSTATLAWTLYMLGAHPQVLQLAQDEVRSVLGDNPPTYETTSQMVYLKQVINETLRLYPPIHLGSRIAKTDLTFKGYHIPADMRVLYSIYLTHRHPDYWENPAAFDPDRFAPGVKHPAYSFLPFGGGPRNCIGAAFAQVESRVVLARLLQRFDFTLKSRRVRPFMGATLEPRPGVWMTANRV